MLDFGSARWDCQTPFKAPLKTCFPQKINYPLIQISENRLIHGGWGVREDGPLGAVLPVGDDVRGCWTGAWSLCYNAADNLRKGQPC